MKKKPKLPSYIREAMQRRIDSDWEEEKRNFITSHQVSVPIVDDSLPAWIDWCEYLGYSNEPFYSLMIFKLTLNATENEN